MPLHIFAVYNIITQRKHIVLESNTVKPIKEPSYLHHLWRIVSYPFKCK